MCCGPCCASNRVIIAQQANSGKEQMASARVLSRNAAERDYRDFEGYGELARPLPGKNILLSYFNG